MIKAPITAQPQQEPAAERLTYTREVLLAFRELPHCKTFPEKAQIIPGILAPNIKDPHTPPVADEHANRKMYKPS